jgi:hypothetical protein
MVKNIINISEREDRIVNIVKAKFGLKNKNQALGIIIQEYARHFLEPSLQQIEKPKRKQAIKVDNLEEVRKVIG